MRGVWIFTAFDFAMLYLGFPYGSNFGWGVLGKEVALALAEITDVRLLCPPALDQRLDDEFDLYRLRNLMLSPGKSGTNVNGAWTLDGPLIHAAVGRNLEPFVAQISQPADLGYAVFEHTILSPSAIEQARQRYRKIVTASKFCADILRKHGLNDVAVVPHGVDTNLFRPRSEPRKFLPDHFIVFSGGKFEFRKGQDVVLCAFRVLQDRHKDVMLVTSWHNNWPQTRDTMSSSRYMRYFPPHDDNFTAWQNAILQANGVDPNRVIIVGPRNHRLLPELYHNTDVGIFPNRAEGGNNMVLMEYMACGKPVLASYNSGHIDILRRQNAVLIEGHRPVEIRSGSELIAVWNEPSVDETIEKLEWCYQHRDELVRFGNQGAVDMWQFTWRRLAEGFCSILNSRAAVIEKTAS